MMRSLSLWLGITALHFAIPSRAQTTSGSETEELDYLLSVAVSVLPAITTALPNIYMELDSFLQAQKTTSGASATATASPTSSSDAASSTDGTSSPTLAAAQPTSTSASDNDNTHRPNTLAIVLGVLLGLLLLAIIILLVFLLVRYRRRNKRLSRQHDDMERVALKRESHPGMSGGLMESQTTLDPEKPRPTTATGAGTTASSSDPNVSKHPALRDQNRNPFVPVPPPPRRSPNKSVAPWSADDMGNYTSVVGGPSAFHSDTAYKGSANPSLSGSALGPQRSGYAPVNTYEGHSGTGKALAAGAGGAALGALAAHKSNRNRDSPNNMYSRDHYNHNPRSGSHPRSGSGSSVVRKPVPSYPASSDQSQAAHLGLDESSAALLGGGDLSDRNAGRHQNGGAWWKDSGAMDFTKGHQRRLTPPDVPSRSPGRDPKRFSFQEDEGENSSESLLQRSTGSTPSSSYQSARNSNHTSPATAATGGAARPGHERKVSLHDLVEQERVLEQKGKKRRGSTNPWDPQALEYHHQVGQAM